MAEYLLGGRAVRVNIGRVEGEIVLTFGEGWARAAASKRCSVSERTLYRFLTGRRVSARTMDRILSGLGLEASDVVTYLKTGGKHGEN
jgi:hypothetical protein